MTFKDNIAQFLGLAAPETLTALEKAKAALAKQEADDAADDAKRASVALTAAAVRDRVATLEATVAAEIASVQNRAAADEIEQHIATKEKWEAQICAAVASGKTIMQRTVELDTESTLECAILQRLFFNADELETRFAASSERLRRLAKDLLAGTVKLPKTEVATVVEQAEQPLVPTIAAAVINPIVYQNPQNPSEQLRAARAATVRLDMDSFASGVKFGLIEKYDPRSLKQQQLRGICNPDLIPPLAQCRSVLTGKLAGPQITDMKPKLPKSSTYAASEALAPPPPARRAPTAEQVAARKVPTTFEPLPGLRKPFKLGVEGSKFAKDKK